jgi:hypothetical protein
MKEEDFIKWTQIGKEKKDIEGRRIEEEKRREEGDKRKER